MRCALCSRVTCCLTDCAQIWTSWSVLSISLTAVSTFLTSWETSPPYYRQYSASHCASPTSTVSSGSRLLLTGSPSEVTITTPSTPASPCVMHLLFQMNTRIWCELSEFTASLLSAWLAACLAMLSPALSRPDCAALLPPHQVTTIIKLSPPLSPQTFLVAAKVWWAHSVCRSGCKVLREY